MCTQKKSFCVESHCCDGNVAEILTIPASAKVNRNWSTFMSQVDIKTCFLIMLQLSWPCKYQTDDLWWQGKLSVLNETHQYNWHVLWHVIYQSYHKTCPHFEESGSHKISSVAEHVYHWTRTISVCRQAVVAIVVIINTIPPCYLMMDGWYVTVILDSPQLYVI
jgi:hypothetical protein